MQICYEFYNRGRGWWCLWTRGPGGIVCRRGWIRLLLPLCYILNKNYQKLIQNFLFYFKQKYAALAFGNIVALTVDSVNIRATCTSALPTRSRSSRGPLMSYKNNSKIFQSVIFYYCYMFAVLTLSIIVQTLSFKQAWCYLLTAYFDWLLPNQSSSNKIVLNALRTVLNALTNYS